ncbi:MAG: hypothetical protein J7518_06415 [Nocardioidaceae bacterium]|nr:hypothetical protein [Nocardioidaceae bacterium]
MNSRGLAEEAAGLSAEEQGFLALILVWLQSPLLRLDSSPKGRERTDVCVRLLESSFDAVVGSGVSTLIREVEGSEELLLEEEPEDLSVYRVDFQSALLYALQAAEGNPEAITWCCICVGDSLDFAVEAGLAAEPESLEPALRSLIGSLREAPVLTEDSARRLRSGIREYVDAIAASIG